jgi:hypothetical protein
MVNIEGSVDQRRKVAIEEYAKGRYGGGGKRSIDDGLETI